MKYGKRAFLIDEQVSPAMLKAMYGLMDIFVATRMHSAIFATSMGVPTLLIEYLDKTRGLGEMLELEDWIVKLEKVNETNMWKMLDTLWQRRFTIRHHLDCLVPGFIEQVNSMTEIITGDFYDR